MMIIVSWLLPLNKIVLWKKVVVDEKGKKMQQLIKNIKTIKYIPCSDKNVERFKCRSSKNFPANRFDLKIVSCFELCVCLYPLKNSVS